MTTQDSKVELVLDANISNRELDNQLRPYLNKKYYLAAVEDIGNNQIRYTLRKRNCKRCQ